MLDLARWRQRPSKLPDLPWSRPSSRVLISGHLHVPTYLFVDLFLYLSIYSSIFYASFYLSSAETREQRRHELVLE